MDKRNWIWMPHGGHFICCSRCRFRLNTYVGGYIVSTVGEMPTKADGYDIDTIGLGRKYETMVFKARKSKHKCCPYEMKDASEIDFKGYNSADAAYAGHLKMCMKWAQKGDKR